MESDTQATTSEERARASRRRSHAQWASKHPKRMRAAQKAWNRSSAGKAGDAAKKRRERTQRAALAALDRPGTYVCLRPDGGTTRLTRNVDGTWEVAK